MKAKTKRTENLIKNKISNKKLLSIDIIIFAIICLFILINTSLFNSVGDTIKTSDLELTLTRAQLATKLERGGGTNPFFPSSSKSSSGYRVADKNHTFVSFSVKVKNISNKKINLEDIFNDGSVIVKYKGVDYYSTSSSNPSKKRCDKNCFKSGYVAWKDEKGVWQFKSFNYMSFTLDPNQKIDEIRIYLDIPVKVKSIKDKFELVFELPNKEKIKKYTYKIK